MILSTPVVLPRLALATSAPTPALSSAPQAVKPAPAPVSDATSVYSVYSLDDGAFVTQALQELEYPDKWAPFTTADPHGDAIRVIESISEDKSYAPSQEQKGVTISLVDVAGRRTLPANEFVRLFDAGYGRADRRLDFVAFLDGHEQERQAVESDAEALRASWRRLKWDIVQR